MQRVLVVGAGGAGGRALVPVLRRRGYAVLALTSRPDRVAEVADGDPHVVVRPVPSRAADTVDGGSLAALVGDAAAEVVVSLVRDPGTRRAVLDAAIATGRSVLDGSLDQHQVGRTYDELGEAARAAGVTVVPAVGAAAGDLLAHLAGAAVTAPRELHVCWSVPSRGGLLGAVSPGARATLAAAVHTPATAVVDGRRREEVAGETRRLAWFPRPVGPAHAASVPGPEVHGVPRHLPGARTVRTYVAIPSWQAELLQFVASAARWPRVRARTTRWLTGSGTEPAAARQAGTRWACVAETVGEEGVARAWAYGHDPQAAAATVTAALVTAVLDGRSDAGVLPPSLVDLPGTLLDRCSAWGDLRWSVARPDR